jgi:NADH-quinone oxidoreductase subunit D
MSGSTKKRQGDAPAQGLVEERHRLVRDLWLSGTEAPADLVRLTSEGAQEMSGREPESVLSEQAGSLISDDYLGEPERSKDEIQVINMGPAHPSTHGVLRLQLELDGEVIRRVKPIIGYLHTGIEKTAESLTYMQGPTAVTRMDYLSPFFNELCFSLAVERLLGIEVPARGSAIRILLTEMNRVASHLVWMASLAMDVAALSVTLYGWRERELFLSFFEKVTGLRMNHAFIRPGGVAADLPDGWEEDVASILRALPGGIEEYEGMLNDNPIFLERTRGVGIITPEECLAFGVTGPVLRATGVDWDLRHTFPYSGIEQYQFEVPLGSNGDVLDRYLVRMEEMKQSLKIISQVAETMPSGDWRSEDLKVTPPPRSRLGQSMEAVIHHFKLFTDGFPVPPGEVYQAVESPRGELGIYLVSAGGSKPWRVHARCPSFAHVQAVPMMMAGGLIADAVATLASIDPLLGDVDR